MGRSEHARRPQREAAGHRARAAGGRAGAPGKGQARHRPRAGQTKRPQRTDTAKADTAKAEGQQARGSKQGERAAMDMERKLMQILCR